MCWTCWGRQAYDAAVSWLARHKSVSCGIFIGGIALSVVDAPILGIEAVRAARVVLRAGKASISGLKKASRVGTVAGVADAVGAGGCLG